MEELIARFNVLEQLVREQHELIQTHIFSKKDWLTVPEFAKATGLTAKYVCELCKAEKLQAVKSDERHGPHRTWRIPGKELERYQREGQLTSD